MDNIYEKIIPWNGANDTGKDVRLKLERNFEKVGKNVEELTSNLSNKLDIAFFKRVFGVLDASGNELPGNDMTTVIDSLKLKVGTWTEEYLSVKGQKEGSGAQDGATSLGGLNNVGSWADEVPTVDRIMVQLAGNTHWSSKNLADIVGLDTTALQTYLDNNSYAKKSDIPSLSGYATQDWVTNKGYLTSSALNGYATQSWVTNQSYATQSALNTISSKVDSFLEGTDTDGIINKWKELEAFLSGQTQSSTLADLLAVKADKSTVTELQSAVNNKLDISYFKRVFGVLDANDNELSGNDMTTVIASLKLKVGTWTEEFFSVKGQNPGTGGSVSLQLSQLADISITSPGNGESLVYSSGLGKWINGAAGLSKVTVKLGNVSYDSVDGTVYLPAYPTALPASDVYPWAKQANKPSYAWDEIGNKPSWIGSTKPPYAWDEISSKPTTFTPSAHTHAWSDIAIGKPTTLAGYGIADAITIDTNQTITGIKSYSSPVRMNGISNHFLPISVGGNATGAFWFNNSDYAYNHVISGIGAHTTDRVLSYLYLGWGASPWEASTCLAISDSLFMYKQNSILHTGNYNSYSPNLNGGGASGTWGISISGNAATSTIAGGLFNGYFTDTNADNNERYKNLISWCSWSENTTNTPFNRHTLGITNIAPDTDYGFQIAKDAWNTHLYHRDRTSGSWSSWFTILDSNNYSSYTLPLMGGVMSNTNLVQNLNADLLDGYQSTDFAKYIFIGSGSINDFGMFGGAFAARVEADVTDLPESNVYNWSLWQQGDRYRGSQFLIHAYGGGTGAWLRSSQWDNTAWNNWRKLAFEDSNVYSATKLQTTRYIFGQPFDGTGNISGNLSDVEHIYTHGYLYSNRTGNTLSVLDYYADGSLALAYGLAQAGLATYIHGAQINLRAPVVADSTFYANGNIYSGSSVYGNGSIELYGNTPFIDFHFENSSADYTSRIIEDSLGKLHATSNFQIDGWTSATRIFTGYDPGVSNSISCSNWFRSSGASGWYNGTFGGGIYMEDTTWVRVYNNKSFHCANEIYAGVGICTDGYLSSKGQNTSDGRLKTDIHKFNGTEIIKSLSPKSFRWNDTAKSLAAVFNTEEIQYGLIAQETKTVAPWLVVDNMFHDGYMGVRYEKLIPVMLACQIEHLSRTEILEEKVSRLEEENKELKRRLGYA